MGKHFQQLLEILDRDVCGCRRGALGDRIFAFVDLAGGGGNPTVREGARAKEFQIRNGGQDAREPPTGMSALLSDQAPPLADSIPAGATVKTF